MICPKCGKKVETENGKFCPDCGTPFHANNDSNGNISNHNSNIIHNNNSSIIHNNNSSIMNNNNGNMHKPVINNHNINSSTKKKFPKKYLAAACTAVLLLALAANFAKSSKTTDNATMKNANQVSKNQISKEQTSQKQKTKIPSLNEAILPDCLSKSQKNELKKEYENAYIDEMNAMNAYIAEYANSFDEYGNIKEEFEELIGTTENFYQALNEFDPNLKNVIAEEAGERYGDSPLDSYLIEQGVGVALSDSELGQEFRGTMEQVGLGLIEALTIWSMESNKTTRKDAITPITIGENYAFVRTFGSIGEMLEQLELNSGYTIAMEAIEARLTDVNIGDFEILDDYSEEDVNEVFESWKYQVQCNARTAALKQGKADWDADLYQQKSNFLTQIGMNADDILGSPLVDIEIDMRNYFDISDREYEQLKKELNSDDLDYIIEQTRGAEALEEYYEHREDIGADDDSLLNGLASYYIYSIIDKEGTLHCSFLSPYSSLNAIINADGMCSITQGELNDDSTVHMIMDKNGNTLFENDKVAAADGSRKIYYGVTPSGNVLRKTFQSDFEHGDYQILEFVKPDGTSQKLMEGGYISLNSVETNSGTSLFQSGIFCSNYYQYTCGYENGNSQLNSGIIDMATGTLITGEDYQQILTEINNAELESLGAAPDMEPLGTEEDKVKSGTRLNEQYVINNSIIYDNSGNEVKKLEDGRGVQGILYTNNQYWIVTNSGWYYILDDNFTEVLKPVELPTDMTFHLTQYGLLIETWKENEDEGRQQVVYLYNEKGEVVLEMSNVTIKTDLHGFILGNEKTGWTNLHTKKLMLVSIPEGGVRLRIE